MTVKPHPLVALLGLRQEPGTSPLTDGKGTTSYHSVRVTPDTQAPPAPRRNRTLCVPEGVHPCDGRQPSRDREHERVRGLGGSRGMFTLAANWSSIPHAANERSGQRRPRAAQAGTSPSIPRFPSRKGREPLGGVATSTVERPSDLSQSGLSRVSLPRCSPGAALREKKLQQEELSTRHHTPGEGLLMISIGRDGTRRIGVDCFIHIRNSRSLPRSQSPRAAGICSPPPIWALGLNLLLVALLQVNRVG